jgi:hypothetical protein
MLYHFVLSCLRLCCARLDGRLPLQRLDFVAPVTFRCRCLQVDSFPFLFHRQQLVIPSGPHFCCRDREAFPMQGPTHEKFIRIKQAASNWGARSSQNSQLVDFQPQTCSRGIYREGRTVVIIVTVQSHSCRRRLSASAQLHQWQPRPW